MRAPRRVAVGAGQRVRVGTIRLSGGGTSGEQNARVDPSAASLMGSVAAAILRTALHLVVATRDDYECIACFLPFTVY